MSPDRQRVSLRPEQATPERFSWLCWLFGCTLACCPDHSVWVYDLESNRLEGSLCPRCGGLFDRHPRFPSAPRLSPAPR